MDRCVSRIGHGSGQEPYHLAADQALCRPCKSGTVPVHGLVMCPSVRPQARSRAWPCDSHRTWHLFQLLCSSIPASTRLVPIRIGHELGPMPSHVPVFAFNTCAGTTLVQPSPTPVQASRVPSQARPNRPCIWTAQLVRPCAVQPSLAQLCSIILGHIPNPNLCPNKMVNRKWT